MMTITRKTAAGAAGLALAAGVGLEATAPASASARPPVAYMSWHYLFPQVHPHGEAETLALATNELYLTTTRWSHWSSSSAHSTAGRLVWRSCWSGCYRYSSAPATQTLYDVRSHGGHRYFARLRFVYKYHGTHTVTAAYSRTGGWTTPRSWRAP
jgi:hypothetical protein